MFHANNKYNMNINDQENMNETNSNNYGNLFNSKNIGDLIDSIFILMKEIVKINPKIASEPNFHRELIENVKEILLIQFKHKIICDSDFEDDLEEFIEENTKIFYLCYMPCRSYPESIIINKNINKEKIKNQIDYLKNKPQPTQRTDEWYLFRHNLITASNAYKAFENQTIKNQLINEKCKPIIKNEITDKNLPVNTTTTLHWGQKYEPLSVMIYEDMYKTKVGDFGCIQHEKYAFLGASPDGINIDPNNERYGRMLEIKNIVNREINGIPKKEYWIQMQLQMEVCDLDECDFLETKFTEYENFNSFNDDHDCKMKGIIIHYNTTENKPYYVYKPLDITTEEEINKWEEEMFNLYDSKMTFIKFIYWKLDILSCVLVLRNKKWFELNIKDISDIWITIEKERENGNVGQKKSIKNNDNEKANNTDTNNNISDNISENISENISKNITKKRKNAKNTKINYQENPNISGCLLNINKETNKIVLMINTENNIENNTEEKTIDYVNKKQTIMDCFKKTEKTQKIQKTQEPQNIIKIRTESFDQTKEKL
jgi:putative phage-type endonuclease